MEKESFLKVLFLSETLRIPPKVSEFLDKVNLKAMFTVCSPDEVMEDDYDIIAAYGKRSLLDFISTVRPRLSEPLIPLIWFNENNDDLVAKAADIPVFFENTVIDYAEIMKESKFILKKVGNFQPIDKYQAPSQIDEVRILRYIVSRNKEAIVPAYSAEALHGFLFPAINTFSEMDSFDLLTKMSIDGLLEQEFYDVVNLCPECRSSHINFREVCPSCKSSDIRQEDYIHHFRCGYLAPESDYREKDSDKLICPKCGRELRHIGVDYDKPSKVFICNSCGNVFEEPESMFFCFNCGVMFDKEEAVKFSVRKYFITKYGRDVAFAGSIASTYTRSLIESDSKILPYSIFEMILEKERKRAQRYGLSSCLLDIDFTSDKISESMLYEMVRDTTNLLKLNLRDTDVITFTERHVLVLLLSTPCSDVQPLIERIRKKLSIFSSIKEKSAEVKFLFAEVK